MKTISVIIPIFRDSKLVKEKIENVLACKYDSGRVEVIIVQGGSRREAVKDINSDDPLIRIVHTTQTGKAAQINLAIRQALGEIILITDVDARMDEICLQEIEKAFTPEVGAVGVWTYPANCMIVDRIYWYVANWIRTIEARIYGASHASGCCIAFRRSALSKLPEDCIADDVYIPFFMGFISGLRTAYIRTTKVKEIRQPKSWSQFCKHKQRKGNAFLREILRFMYMINYGPVRWKLIYFFRLVQFTVLTPTILLSYPFYNQDRRLKKVGGK